MKARIAALMIVLAAVVCSAQDTRPPETGAVVVQATATSVMVIRSEGGWDLLDERGKLPAGWVDPRTARGGQNHSQRISNGPLCAKKDLATVVGNGMVVAASTPTWGEMWFESEKRFIYGYTVVNEALVVDPQACFFQLWRRHGTSEYRVYKWHVVRRGYRCANEYHAVALRDIRLEIPTPCPVKEIERQFVERVEYVDRFIYRQIEVPAVNVTINRPPELVITIQNPAVEMHVEFQLPAPSAPIGFVPVHSGGQINAIPRMPSVERRLAGVSIGFVPVPKINISNNVSASASGGNAVAYGGSGGNATATANANASASATQTQGQSQTCPPLPAPPPQPPPPTAGPTCGPLTPGSGIQVIPSPGNGQVVGPWAPVQPTPGQAGGP